MSSWGSSLSGTRGRSRRNLFVSKSSILMWIWALVDVMCLGIDDVNPLQKG